MVKLDVTALRYMTKEEFRTLAAVEQGMRNHEFVPVELVSLCTIPSPSAMHMDRAAHEQISRTRTHAHTHANAHARTRTHAHACTHPHG